MGGTTLPTASTPGYTLFRGRVTCVCLAEWLPVLEDLLLALGVIKQSIDLVQLTGGNPLSGGTHTQGGAFDIRQHDPVTIRCVREMGAPGSWPREGAAWAGNEHCHGALLGCPHNQPVRYQLDAQRAGFDGLGQGKTPPHVGEWGYGGLDPSPGPDTYRTWKQGIAWAKSEIARLNAPSAPALIGGLSMADINSIDAKLDALLAQAKGLRSEEAGRYQVDTGRFTWLAGALRGIAEKTGTTVDVDEAALASQIVSELAPQIATSLAAQVAKIAPAVSVEDVQRAAADAVRSVLGSLDAPPSA